MEINNSSKISIKALYVILFLFLLVGCSQKKENEVQRSFYYWKTVFNLSPTEHQYLSTLSIQHLYVKLFDVSWNPEKKSPQPLAKSIFTRTPPSGILITPVVFITQETLKESELPQLDSLAVNICQLLSSICKNSNLRLSGEVQFDCDWSTTTKEKYFRLLANIKKQPFIQTKTVSATIRLHQLKFVSENGLPPVEKGLLMCYNMGNLRQPEIKNSIIEVSELKKYINHLQNYPLKLDIALPIFDWYVLFDRNIYKGLIHSMPEESGLTSKEKIEFTEDRKIDGISFKKGQWLRHEQSHINELITCAKMIRAQMMSKDVHVILYHLDEHNLAKYTTHELENIFNCFR